MVLTYDELEELASLIETELPERILNLLIRLNQANDGRLEKLLELLEMQDFLQQEPEVRRWATGKIAIIGACEVGENDLKGMFKREGFDASRFELVLDYNKAKRTDFSYLRNTNYAAILAGQLSHKGKNIGNHDSLFEYLRDKEEGFPPLRKLCKNNQNRITISSVRTALNDLVDENIITRDWDAAA